MNHVYIVLVNYGDGLGEYIVGVYQTKEGADERADKYQSHASKGVTYSVEIHEVEE